MYIYAYNCRSEILKNVFYSKGVICYQESLFFGVLKIFDVKRNHLTKLLNFSHIDLQLRQRNAIDHFLKFFSSWISQSVPHAWVVFLYILLYKEIISNIFVCNKNKKQKKKDANLLIFCHLREKYHF